MITQTDAAAIARFKFLKARAAALMKLKVVYEKYCRPKFEELDDDKIAGELGELAGLIADFRGLHRQKQSNGIG